MKTVSQTLYFYIFDNIADTIEALTNISEKAIAAGMIEGTGKLEHHGHDEFMFTFKRPETEKERLHREEIQAVKAAKEAANAKAKEDEDRAIYERLKAKFEGAK